MGPEAKKDARENAKEILKICQIPAVPRTLQAILQALNEESTTSYQLEQLILKDASISLNLLKLVNSSFYNLGQKVTSIQAAVVLLGYSAVKSLAASLAMLETFSKMKQVNREYLLKVWTHSMASARVIAVLTRKLNQQLQNKLFLAALIHDVGHVILMLYRNLEYLKLVSLKEFPEPEDEIRVVGVSHTDLGAELAVDWEISKEVSELIRYHHEQSNSAQKSPVLDPMGPLYLKAADVLAEWLQSQGNTLPENESKMPEPIKNALQQIGWDWSTLQGKKTEMETAVNFPSLESN